MVKNYQPSQAQLLPTTGLEQIEQLWVLVCDRSGRETGGGLIIPNSLKDSLPLEVEVGPEELLVVFLSFLTSFRISFIAISFVLLIFLWTPSASFSSNSLPHPRMSNSSPIKFIIFRRKRIPPGPRPITETISSIERFWLNNSRSSSSSCFVHFFPATGYWVNFPNTFPIWEFCHVVLPCSIESLSNGSKARHFRWQDHAESAAEVKAVGNERPIAQALKDE